MTACETAREAAKAALIHALDYLSTPVLTAEEFRSSMPRKPKRERSKVPRWRIDKRIKANRRG